MNKKEQGRARVVLELDISFKISKSHLIFNMILHRA